FATSERGRSSKSSAGAHTGSATSASGAMMDGTAVARGGAPAGRTNDAGRSAAPPSLITPEYSIEQKAQCAYRADDLHHRRPTEASFDGNDKRIAGADVQLVDGELLLNGGANVRCRVEVLVGAPDGDRVQVSGRGGSARAHQNVSEQDVARHVELFGLVHRDESGDSQKRLGAHV